MNSLHLKYCPRSGGEQWPLAGWHLHYCRDIYTRGDWLVLDWSPCASWRMINVVTMRVSSVITRDKSWCDLILHFVAVMSPGGIVWHETRVGVLRTQYPTLHTPQFISHHNTHKQLEWQKDLLSVERQIRDDRASIRLFSVLFVLRCNDNV